MPTITRFPPSPTGDLHIGGARTALFNWLYARKTGGELVLRIEDTDLQRSSKQATDVILQGMKWLGLSWNQGPFYQTKRFERYAQVIAQLLQQGDCYYCNCSKQRLEQVRDKQRKAGQKPRYDHHCRELGIIHQKNQPQVIRFRNPLEGSVVFDDVVRGEVVIANAELDDLIIARADGAPTYNLTVVVDDMDMGISHVIRGDDHINNTPRQINIFNALGATPPIFAHVPLIIGADGQRLSKRHGAVSVLAYREMGILPEALLNYLVRLGWSHRDQEIFNIDEMIELFDLADINKSAASFDMEKLLWLNQHYIKAADTERLGNDLAKRLHARGIGLSAGPKVNEVVEILRDRARSMQEMAQKSLYLYADVAQYQEAAAAKHLTAEAAPLLTQLSAELAALAVWDCAQINAAITNVLQKFDAKLPRLALPLRVAISGDVATPSIDITVKMIGYERVIARIEKALLFIQQQAAQRHAADG